MSNHLLRLPHHECCPDHSRSESTACPCAHCPALRSRTNEKQLAATPQPSGEAMSDGLPAGHSYCQLEECLTLAEAKQFDVAGPMPDPLNCRVPEAEDRRWELRNTSFGQDWVHKNCGFKA